MKLTSIDFGLLVTMYFYAPTIDELGKQNKECVYRLSRAQFCMCDTPGQHPGQPRCWSLTQSGQALVDHIDQTQGQAWRDPQWSIEINAREWIRAHADDKRVWGAANVKSVDY